MIPFGVAVTDLSKTMLIVVTRSDCSCMSTRSGTWREERDMARYFGGLSLFMFSMLGIVLADNFVMMFIFWELVGVSSYLLIGHWYERPQAADAANKAFLVNRIGDFGFMAGILDAVGHHGPDRVLQAGGHDRPTVERPDVSDAFLPYLTVAALLFSAGRWANPPRCRCTSGCRTRWKARRRFPR